MTFQKLFPLLVLLCGCPNASNGTGPPLDKLYFPMGIAHVDVPGKAEGVLFVATANSDKRYATGSIVALALDSLGLPELDAGVSEVRQFPNLNIDAGQSVQISSFAGELAIQSTGPGAYRIYVPTRSEGMNVFQTQATIDANGVPSLQCIGESSQNCVATGVSLTPETFAGSDAGVQWALTPYGVAAAPRACIRDAECCSPGVLECAPRSCSGGKCMGSDGQPFADIWVTYAPRGDASNLLSNTALTGYLARLDSDDFTLKEDTLIPIGGGGSNSVAPAGDWVYVSGRILSPAPNLMRVVNRDRIVLSTALESSFRVSDARSIALSSDGKRLFIVGRVPDTLLIVNINEASGFPSLSFLRGVPLPDAPNDVKVISRPGRGDLVVVSCSAAGSVVLYDDDVGDLVSLVGGVGVQPYGVAVDVRGNSARIFVSNFGDGRIAVIDVPDLDRPQRARLVAHLGAQQLCLTRGQSSPGCTASKELQ